MSARATPARVAKLPLWAQHRIDQLERSVEYWTAKAVQVDTDDTDVSYGPYGNEFALPRDSRVMFNLDRERPRVSAPNQIGLQFTTRGDRTYLELYCTDGRLAISGMSSNVMLAEVTER